MKNSGMFENDLPMKSMLDHSIAPAGGMQNVIDASSYVNANFVLINTMIDKQRKTSQSSIQSSFLHRQDPNFYKSEVLD